jgi:hypothetical protein
MAKLTEDQINAIRCAYYDLVGALQAYDSMDYSFHDWKGHRLSIDELQTAFFDIIKETE